MASMRPVPHAEAAYIEVYSHIHIDDVAFLQLACIWYTMTADFVDRGAHRFWKCACVIKAYIGLQIEMSCGTGHCRQRRFLAATSGVVIYMRYTTHVCSLFRVWMLTIHQRRGIGAIFNYHLVHFLVYEVCCDPFLYRKQQVDTIAGLRRRDRQKQEASPLPSVAD